MVLEVLSTVFNMDATRRVRISSDGVYPPTWLTASSFLILPTTFDSDPKLRFSRGVLTILIVGLLTGGYSLTALLWFGCPSILFRQRSIFLPSASASAFGFFACAWTLMTSERYVASSPSCPATIILTLISSFIYGGLALYTHRRINQMSMAPVWPTQPVAWQDPNYQQYYASSPYPSVSHSVGTELPAKNHYSPPLTEDEQVTQQMARLLTKTDPGPSPDATQGTFRLEWPPGGDVDDENVGKLGVRSRTFPNAGNWLAPPTQSRHARNRSDGVEDDRGSSAWSKFGRVVGMADRGRKATRDQKDAVERAKSRDERRREIEMGNM